MSEVALTTERTPARLADTPPMSRNPPWQSRNQAAWNGGWLTIRRRSSVRVGLVHRPVSMSSPSRHRGLRQASGSTGNRPAIHRPHQPRWRHTLRAPRGCSGNMEWIGPGTDHGRVLDDWVAQADARKADVLDPPSVGTGQDDVAIRSGHHVRYAQCCACARPQTRRCRSAPTSPDAADRGGSDGSATNRRRRRRRCWTPRRPRSCRCRTCSRRRPGGCHARRSW